MDRPIVDATCVLKKFPGKGGWTYAEIPHELQEKTNVFGWLKVRGMIDDHVLNGYSLMPMGDGRLMLAVKAAIRKKIGKQEGDRVKIVLYKDDRALVIPDELLLCLEDEPEAKAKFLKLTDGAKKMFIDWIYQAKKEETRMNRIVKTMEKVLQGKKYP